jgi:hypothetical protein
VSGHVLERLSAYLDGEILVTERQAIDVHLRECAECARRLEELAAVDEAARRMPLPEPPGYFEAFPARLRERLGREQPSAAPVHWRLPAWTWAAAAALFLAVITPAVLRRGSPPAPGAPEYPAPAAADAVSSGVPSPAPAAPREAAEARLETAASAPPATYAYAQAPQAKAKARANDASLEADRAASLAKKADAPVEGKLAGRLEQQPSEAAPVTGEATPLAEDAQQRLRDLGYVGAGAERPAAEPVGQSQVAPRTAPGTVGGFAPAPALPTISPAPPPTEADRKDDRGRRQAPGAKRELGPEKQAAPEAQPPADGYAAKAMPASPSAPEAEHRRLAATSPRSALEARTLRGRWLELARRQTDATLADEARVRAILASADAYRLSGLPADLEVLRADVAAYLARPDARQSDRVRALLPGRDR